MADVRMIVLHCRTGRSLSELIALAVEDVVLNVGTV
jgi:hypothetical protein